jgi:CheY-like chemotaxis protein
MPMLFALRHGGNRKPVRVETMLTPSIVPISPGSVTRAHKPVILLVEDECVVREVTRQVLEHAGYQVLESDGPREAMRLAEVHQGRIALLLSDVVMPGMSGIDLARRIQKTQPWLATVFMSGYANPVVLQKAEPAQRLHPEAVHGGCAADGRGRGAGQKFGGGAECEPSRSSRLSSPSLGFVGHRQPFVLREKHRRSPELRASARRPLFRAEAQSESQHPPCD